MDNVYKRQVPNRETGHMGQNYFRSLFAVGFQGLLILVCVAIYAGLIQSIATDGDPIGAIWGLSLIHILKYLLLYLEETYGLTSEKKIETAIWIVANEKKYHPSRDVLNSLAWDGTERIRFCLRHFLGADVDDYTYEALKLFMLGAITRAFKPGSKFEIMLCLVGGQGAGKSTFVRLLAVRDEWFSDDLRKLDDDNVYRKLQGHWMIEMSEMMATANAKSIEAVSYTHLDVYKRQVIKRYVAGEEVRIWYSYNPDELCGMYWLCLLYTSPSERKYPCRLQ